MIAEMSRDRSYIQRRAEVAMRRLAKDLRARLEKAHDFASGDCSAVLHEANNRGLPVDSVEELRDQPLQKREALATTFIQSAKIWSAGEGASLGAAGIVSVPADVVALVATNLRMIQSIAAAYGFRLDHPNGRIEAWLPIVRVLGIESIPDDWHAGPKPPPRKALSQLVSEVAKSFAHRLVKEERARAVPLVGAVAGGISNYAFTSEVGARAQSHFRALADGGHEEPAAKKTKTRQRETSSRSAQPEPSSSKRSSRA